MHRCLLIFLFFGWAFNLSAQNPHGEDLKMDCVACHTSDGWEIAMDAWNFIEDPKVEISQITGWQLKWDTLNKFNHFNTSFPLEGQHAGVDCRACHSNLVFAPTSVDCISCHTDVHQQTVGSDCVRCHTAENWLVDNITELHQENGFPLLGMHATAACIECHQSESGLQFARIGNECINCHLTDFNATTNPNHEAAGFSMDCVDCHTIESIGWFSETMNHDFFPLTKGHAIEDCNACHIDRNFTNTPTDCFTCHQSDFTASLVPNHETAGFSTNCVDCHTTDVGWEPAEYADHDNHFPIYSGAHQGVWEQCIDCHNNSSDYTQFTCTNCHINPETAEQHAAVSGYVYENTACLACHPAGNADDIFDHGKTNFPLTGAHIDVECLACHSTGYAGTPTDCAACHQMDFEQTVNPNHKVLNLSTDCVSCHTTEPDWMPARFDNHDDFYPLNGAHAAIANDCAACHNGDYTNTPTTCFGCHAEAYNSTTNPDHKTSGFSTECQSCHSETSWLPATFDHDLTAFPLTGAHIDADCIACHENGYIDTPTDCAACHQLDFDQTINPNHKVLNLSSDCVSCHLSDATNWMPATFDIHDKFYELKGAHAAIANDCVDCHNGDFNNTPNTCAGCHTDDYNQTTNPDHKAAQFPLACESCHTETAWTPSAFNHDEFYPLTGGHKVIENDCVACHQGDYDNTPNTCIGCHTQDFDQTVNPNHRALNLTTDCESCHTTEPDWMPARFDIHDQFYRLNGAHAAIANDCVACHNGDYNNTPNTCFGCHATDFNQTTEPNHITAGFPTDCTLCHTETAWEPATFDHDQTAFPLRGAHTTVDCIECHADGYAGTPTDCIACHQTDFDQTTDPNHTTSGFSTNCVECHSETAWEPAIFDHDLTAFPLTGAHLDVDCIACHENGYAGTPTDCAACHQLDFDQTINPNHKVLNLSTDCVTCHLSDATSWMPATFDQHNEFYELKGAHAAIANDCVDCHNGDFNNTPNTCAGCHTDDFNQTTEPDHKAAKFPLACESCHTEAAWTPSTFNHYQFYPLTGGHKVIENDCVACHQGDYDNTPNTCVGCHTQDFEQTVNPNHRALNLTTDCESCHTTEPDWMPARFDIHDQFYRLNGAHAAIANDCVACHNGDYNNTPNTCFGCHATHFNNATDPNHKTAGFSTNCLECHTETAWEPATFDHDLTDFPLRGAHATTDCIECHADGYTGTPTDCVACHQSDFDQTTDPNHKAAGFPTDCIICHTETDWEATTFDHDQTQFPLRGAHATTDCIECHADGYVGTPTDCITCHQSDFDQTTDPNHKAAGFPTDCKACHTEGTWVPATFDHDQTNFPLRGAHATTDCIECHADGYAGTPTECIACHQSDFNNARNPNHRSAGFPMDCTQCHSEIGWEPSSFDHDAMYFPIYSGNHQNEWTLCSECHINNDFNSFSCIDCHEHNDPNQLRNDHDGVNGYRFVSSACYECHPNGDE